MGKVQDINTAIKHLTTVDKFLNSIDSSRSAQIYYGISYDFSTAIFEARRKSGLTKKEFATALDISEYKLDKLESGDYNFTLEDFCQVCDKLGLNIEVRLIHADREREEAEPFLNGLGV